MALEWMSKWINKCSNKMLLVAVQSDCKKTPEKEKREKESLSLTFCDQFFPFVALIFGGWGWVDMRDDMGMKIRVKFQVQIVLEFQGWKNPPSLSRFISLYRWRNWDVKSWSNFLSRPWQHNRTGVYWPEPNIPFLSKTLPSKVFIGFNTSRCRKWSQYRGILKSKEWI